MLKLHLAAIITAFFGAILLLVAMLFGTAQMPQIIGVDKSWRDVAVALWGFLVPAWFVIEETWFAPLPTNAPAMDKFRAGQQKARVTWMVVGGAVGIVLGLTAPTIRDQPPRHPKEPRLPTPHPNQIRMLPART